MKVEPRSKHRLTRRGFLAAAAVAGGGIVVPACKRTRGPMPKRDFGPPGKALSGEELALCGAACERILPKDQDPGAVELGVVAFIDRRLSRKGKRAVQAGRRLRRGLHSLSEWTWQRHGRHFVDLGPGEQDVMLASFAAEGGDEAYAALHQLVVLTLDGAFSDPVYGGNQGRLGWKLVGFDAPCPNPRCE
ncbi:MAG: gluconate 2-dehydrogenase subunit 3 family protein [Deltaproteobacteria bacterium]